jgi:hypothetical protein
MEQTNYTYYFHACICILGAYAFFFTLLAEQLGGFIQPFPVSES